MRSSSKRKTRRKGKKVAKSPIDLLEKMTKGEKITKRDEIHVTGHFEKTLLGWREKEEKKQKIKISSFSSTSKTMFCSISAL